MALTCKAFGDIITFTRASSATFTGSNGLIQSATTNTPRFDYDPVTLAAKGLLIEEQRTNLLTYSEQFDNAVWSKVASTVTANATTAPDGTTTADKLVENTATADHSMRGQTVTVTSGATYTHSIYLKAGERTKAEFYYVGSSDRFLVDLVTGGVTITGGAPVVRIDNAGNGWFRIAYVQVAPSTSLTACYLAMYTTSIAYTGDGTSGLFMWGAQLEAGSFATSYIPTVASQVTRSADVASVNTLSPWYNATEGTLYAEVTPYGVTADTRVASFDDGTSANRILIWGTSSGSATRYEVRTGSVTQVNESIGSTLIANATTKAAAAYKANDFAFSVNGGAAVLDASGTVPTVNKLNIGGSTGAPLPSGAIRRITYYPRRLSNAELQAITA